MLVDRGYRSAGFQAPAARLVGPSSAPAASGDVSADGLVKKVPVNSAAWRSGTINRRGKIHACPRSTPRAHNRLEDTFQGVLVEVNDRRIVGKRGRNHFPFGGCRLTLNPADRQTLVETPSRAGNSPLENRRSPRQTGTEAADEYPITRADAAGSEGLVQGQRDAAG
jgi:hypothetical protein